MPRDRDPVYIQDIINAAREAISFLQNKTTADLLQDKILARALERSIMIIGEAASNVSSELHDKYPEVEWGRMIGTRNIIVHAYSKVDLEILWQIVKQNLPQLVVRLEQILDEESTGI